MGGADMRFQFGQERGLCKGFDPFRRDSAMGATGPCAVKAGCARNTGGYFRFHAKASICAILHYNWCGPPLIRPGRGWWRTHLCPVPYGRSSADWEAMTARR